MASRRVLDPATVDLAKPSPKGSATVSSRVFEMLGDQRYRLTLQPAGIVLEAERVRRHSHELWGEVRCTVNGALPLAKKVYADILHAGDLNFSSTQARGSRAKILSGRSGAEYLDWEGFVEELAYRIQDYERSGKPGVVLADEPIEEDMEGADDFHVSGWPVLGDLPMVLFGDSDTGKSYWAMWVAGCLAQAGITVIYADWEFSKKQHQLRFQRLFQPRPKNLIYVRCENSMKYEIDRLMRLMADHRASYIVCDSIGFACAGDPVSAEVANEYFRAVRQFPAGSLHIAHTPKQYDDGKEAQIFGSAFFKAGARSVWFIDRTRGGPKGELTFGLFQRKNNLGDQLAPRGYKLLFRDKRTLVEAVDVRQSDELSMRLPLLERVERYLTPGAQTVKAIAEEMNCTAAVVRSLIARHKSKFVRLGGKIGVLHDGAFGF